jgi:hypothetical protein
VIIYIDGVTVGPSEAESHILLADPKEGASAGGSEGGRSTLLLFYYFIFVVVAAKIRYK